MDVLSGIRDIFDFSAQLDFVKTQVTKTRERFFKSKQKKHVEPEELKQAKAVIDRIHFLLTENPVMDLGKEIIYERDVVDPNGNMRKYAYTVDFSDRNQVKRLKAVLKHLLDVSSDRRKTDYETIPSYLDYIAQTSL